MRPKGAAGTALRRFVSAMPKVELHVHLEGAIRPSTLLRLARRRRIELPATDERELARWLRFRDFDHFIEVYLLVSRCLRDPEDFQRVVADFMAEQARQNVRYTEAHFTISTHAANGANPGEVADAMAEAIAEGERRWPTRLVLIPDIVRNAEFSRADLTLEWALANHGRSVVALGIGGKESHSSAPFRSHFVTAAREGLGRVAHAGEQLGPESIRATLDDCAPQRLGHGIRAVDDPELVRQLRREMLPLEVCPTSNLRLGLVEDLASHPFGALYRAGVELSLNTDDPALFDTDLERELLGAAETFQLSGSDLRRLTLAAVEHSFLPPTEKRRLAEEIETRCRELAAEHLGEELSASHGDKPGAV